VELGLDGKVALVTAASKGLGRGAALALSREGARVVICARGEARLLATAEERRQRKLVPSLSGATVSVIRAGRERTGRRIPTRTPPFGITATHG